MIRRHTLRPAPAGLKACATAALAVLFTLVAAASGPLQTPEQFLGFKVGADNKLVRWDKIVDYMKQAAATRTASAFASWARPATTTRSSPWKSARRTR